MKKPLPTEFLIKHWRFEWSDAVWGVRQGWAEPAFLVELATEQLLHEQDPPEQVVELAGLQSDSHEVLGLAAHVAQRTSDSRGRDSGAKWMYLVLKWTFENRLSMRDPFNDVETVYSEFGYPRAIEHFVRYMPPRLYDPRKYTRTENEERLFRAWEDFLIQQELLLYRE